jgi:hemerythrin-like domain-containing protein
MLEACHERVQRTLDLLVRLQEYVNDKGVDAQARSAAQDVMRYFDIAAPLHHQDEELHVFPALLAGTNVTLKERVFELLAQHRAMELGWQYLRGTLQALLNVDESATYSFTFSDADGIDAFVAMYGTHIQTEEQLIYPAAAALISPERVEIMSADMMKRRGAKRAV